MSMADRSDARGQRPYASWIDGPCLRTSNFVVVVVVVVAVFVSSVLLDLLFVAVKLSKSLLLLLVQ